MGEAKRKRDAMRKAAFEAVRATLWTVLGEGARRMGVERGDLLALLLEYGMLLGGFTVAESDRFIARMEDIERGLDEHERSQSQPAPTAEPEASPFAPEGPWLPPLPGVKQPIDPEFMARVEDTARRLATAIGSVIEGTGFGFLLMLFGIGDRSEMTYLTNCEREDVVAMLREFIPILEQRLDVPPGVLTGRPN